MGTSSITSPNFSPGSRFLAAFIEGGVSRHAFADLERPNLEVLDLYSQTLVVGSKPLFLAWAHGDMFFSPGEAPCLRNSCSANLVVYQALVDNASINLSEVINTYKSFPTGFYMSFDLEAALATVRGLPIRSRAPVEKGWMSLLSARLNSRDMPEAQRDLVQQRLLEAAHVSAEPVFGRTSSSGNTPLEWYAQNKLVALSQHCIPDRTGACAKTVDAEYKFPTLRLTHQSLRREDGAADSANASNSRLIAVRSAGRSGTSGVPIAEPLANVIHDLLKRVGGEATMGWDQAGEASQVFDVSGNLDGNLKTAERRVAQVKAVIARRAPEAVRLLPDAKRGLELEATTGGGCLTEGELPFPFTHQIDRLHQVYSASHSAWLFRASCSNGASGRYWLWGLFSSSGRPPVLIDLSLALHPYHETQSPQSVGGHSVRSVDALAVDWPQTVDDVKIFGDRFLIAHGTWPDGRWAMVFDIEARRISGFIRRLENADNFKSLSISQAGERLIQLNADGQIYIYDVKSGRVLLRGSETDEELVVYDDNGYYLSTPEGAHFVNVKFPGIAGYNTVHQFARTLHRPDIIKAVLAGKSAPPKPNLAPPPVLSVTAKVQSMPGERAARVTYETTSATGLASLRIFVDGRPVQDLPLSGTEAKGAVDVPLPPEARWISAVAVDTSGYESVARGQPLLDAAKASASRLFAITVGTDTYDDKAIATLTAAKRDADAFAKGLDQQKGAIYSEVVIVPLLDDADLKTSLPGRLREIAAQATERDTIMLFVAGHGFRAKDGKFHLVTPRTDTQRLEETSLAWDEVAAAFSGVKARAIVFLDACRSGAAGQSATNDEAVDALLGRSLPITVIAASKGRQDSEETDKGGEFTNSVLRALANRKATDTNGNGAIELAELYAVVKRDVVVATQGRQTPWLARNDMVGEVPLF